MGGVAAALSVTAMGFSAVLTEETDWLGGQMSSQGIPPDEHRWIEQCGCTRSYRDFRDRVRRFYGYNYPLTPAQQGNAHLNPGAGTVSRIAHEPRIASYVVEEMLAASVSANRLRILKETVPVAVHRAGGAIRQVEFLDKRSGDSFPVRARFVLDATELGDLLELGDIPYITGSEGSRQTGELHDPSEGARPDNMQAITWAAAVGFDPECDENCDHYRIEKPASYEHWKNDIPELLPPWPGPLLSWRYSNPRTLLPKEGPFFLPPEQSGFSFWKYRRILAAENFRGEKRWHEVSILNWPQNDYFEKEIVNVSGEARKQRFQKARELTLSLVYWLQNDAPRPDEGEGYSGLYLRGDVMGTSDGLAKYPYIREARRIAALQTVTECDIGVLAREGHRPAPLKDSVGIGYYRIDLHPSTGGDNYVDVESFPFQIPLSALIAPGFGNFLPACKNIGTTHISNGSFRLHPVEWNIGEAAGCVAAFCLQRGCTPEALANHPRLLADLQSRLVQMGVELEWPESVYEEHAQQIESIIPVQQMDVALSRG